MTTLASCGCSFSDYTGDSISKTYGHATADLLGLDYLHLARGCSNKDRVYKLVVDAVRYGKLVEGDIVIVQFPDPNRAEMYSPWNHYLNEHGDNLPKLFRQNNSLSLRDSSFGEYAFYNFKPLLNDYANNDQGMLPDLFKAAQDYSNAAEVLGAVNERFILHDWQVRNSMFEAFLEQHNIQLMYYNHRTTGLWHHHFQNLDLTSKQKYWDDAFPESNIWHELTQSMSQQQLQDEYLLGWDTIKGQEPTQIDDCHYSQLGHTYMAERLASHIVEKDYLKG